jgi:hypothetical protein
MLETVFHSGRQPLKINAYFLLNEYPYYYRVIRIKDLRPFFLPVSLPKKNVIVTDSLVLI